MKKMKRLLVAMLSCLTAFACVAGMSACGDKKESSSESVQAPASSESVVESVEPESSEEVSSEEPESSEDPVSSVEPESSEDVSSEEPDSSSEEPAPHEHAWVEGRAPTCLNNGECVDCGIVEGSLLGHSIANWTVSVEATCTEQGTQVGVCARCEVEVTEPIAKADHVLEVVAEAVEPTCEEAGKAEALKCANCDYTEGGEEIAALGHDWAEVAGTEATCTEDGVEAATVCNTCGATEGGAVIPATGHTWTVEPTCGVNGVCEICGEVEGSTLDHVRRFNEQKFADCYNAGATTYFYDCANCGLIDTEWAEEPLTPADYQAIPAGHMYDPAEATCTAGAVCYLCGEVVTKTLPHSLVKFEGLAPTCDETGYKPYKACQYCDYTDYEVIDALGHTYSYTEVYVAPTCVDTGLMYAGECTVCGHIGGEVEIEALGHKIVKAPDCVNNAVCGVCGEVEDTALGHDYSGVIEAVEETCTTIGWAEHNYCVVCNAIEDYEEYAALGHDFGDKVEVTPKAEIECDVEYVKVAHYVCNTCGGYATTNKVNAKCVEKEAVIAVRTHVLKTSGTEYVKAKAATCTEDGYVATGVCTYCGFAMDAAYYGADYTIAALGHDGERAANFDEEGNFTKFVNSASRHETCQKEEYCAICKTENWNEADHVASVTYYTAVSATCQYAGNIAYGVCECGQIWVEASEETPDVFVENGYTCVKTWTSKTDRETEEVTYTAKTFYKESDVTLKQLNHSYDIVVEGVDATCTTAGYKSYNICRFCGEVEGSVKVIAALGHVNAGEGKTCSAILECEVCDEIYANEKRTEAHVYTTDGECAVCGECANHVYVESVVVAGQYTIYECTVCGKERTEAVELK